MSPSTFFSAVAVIAYFVFVSLLFYWIPSCWWLTPSHLPVLQTFFAYGLITNVASEQLIIGLVGRFSCYCFFLLSLFHTQFLAMRKGIAIASTNVFATDWNAQGMHENQSASVSQKGSIKIALQHVSCIFSTSCSNFTRTAENILIYFGHQTQS